MFFKSIDFQYKGIDIYTNEIVEGYLIQTDFGLAIEEKESNEINVFKEKNSFYFKTKIHLINESIVCKKFPDEKYNLYSGDIVYFNFTKDIKKIFKSRSSGYYILIYDSIYGWGFEQIYYQDGKILQRLNNVVDPLTFLEYFDKELVVTENYFLKEN